jgi:hypothetical protein
MTAWVQMSFRRSRQKFQKFLLNRRDYAVIRYQTVYQQQIQRDADDGYQPTVQGGTEYWRLNFIVLVPTKSITFFRYESILLLPICSHHLRIVGGYRSKARLTFDEDCDPIYLVFAWHSKLT